MSTDQDDLPWNPDDNYEEKGKEADEEADTVMPDGPDEFRKAADEIAGAHDDEGHAVRTPGIEKTKFSDN